MDIRGWWMSEKLDGVRGYWTGEQLVSRSGKVFAVAGLVYRKFSVRAVRRGVMGRATALRRDRQHCAPPHTPRRLEVGPVYDL